MHKIYMPVFFFLLVSVGMSDPPQTRNFGRAIPNSTQNRPNVYGGYNQYGMDYYDRFFMNQMGGFTYQRGPASYTPANIYPNRYVAPNLYYNQGRYDSRNGNR